MLDRPVLWPSIAVALMAGGLIEISRRTDAGGLKTLWQFAAAVLFVYALVKGVDWLWWRVIAGFRQTREAMAVTAQVKLVQAVSQLDEAQLRFLELERGVIEVMAGAPEPSYVLKVGGGSIPFEFIYQFLDLDDGDYLCPIGTWTEGSKRREWAQLLTNHLVMQGLAEMHNGNKAARWLDKPAALRWMGMDGK